MQSEEERIETFKRATKEQRIILNAVEELLEEDVILCANNDVLIRIRLGEKVIAEYPIHCDVTDNEVLISEYANTKSDQRREE